MRQFKRGQFHFSPDSLPEMAVSNATSSTSLDDKNLAISLNAEEERSVSLGNI